MDAQSGAEELHGFNRNIVDRQERGRGEEEEEVESPQTTHSKVVFLVRTLIGILLFLLVLACATLSKLTLVSLTDNLGYQLQPTVNASDKDRDKSAIPRLYWQLLFIMVLPHCVTFVRSAIVGVIGKTTKAYPWPSKKAIILGAIFSVVEVLAMSTFVFSVLCYLTPDIALLSMSGVFLVQLLLDVYYVPCKYKCQQCIQYEPMHEELQPQSVILGPAADRRIRRVQQCFEFLLENKLVRSVAFGLQLLGLVGLIVCIGLHLDKKKELEYHLPPIVALPLTTLALSIMWSNKVQECVLTTKNTTCNNSTNARYKAGFINSAIRIFLFPILAYVVFRLIHIKKKYSDPWCLYGNECELDFVWRGEELAVFLTQLLTSFFGYIFAWIACIMTIHVIGFALPLLLSTPVAIAWYHLDKDHIFPPFSHREDTDYLYPKVPLICLAIYFGQLLGMAYYLCTKSNLILSQDKDMFLNPHYDAVFLEQQLALNRQVNKYETSSNEKPDRSRCTIFICSTMYRENVTEMRQMLNSIKRISDWYYKQVVKRGASNADAFESHIFFDGAMNGNQLTHFALQLVSLVKDCLGVELQSVRREETPYGHRLTWFVGLQDMRFTIHLKDNLKVKNKKRWSQVMYMNYILKHRIELENLSKDNTFILTTDADIDFTADSAVVLLDTLASNKEVGAVCARTHPKGSGPVYWYQIFDYAIGHWFLKPAEHLLGCVLCCPGCFSVFRCSALAEVLDEYSSEVDGALEFLTKDMGEDRWLCTLLIQKGWRLEYCAISEDYTYCPLAFDEFYKQRRRWVPSTIANLSLLISKAVNITRMNNSVSLLFILFQAIMVFSTAISPATVILIVGSGLQGAYKISNDAVLAIIVILLLLSVGYGLLCMYTSQKTQLDVAKLLTFLFAILMAVVVAGIFKEIIFSIFPEDNELTSFDPPICPSRNGTPDPNCLIAKNNLEVAANLTQKKSIHVPDPTTLYIGLFGVTFVVAALLHFREWACLLHCVWYLLALPSGYLLLLIYSAANLDSQSWGTREAKVQSGGGAVMVKKWVRQGLITIRNLFQWCCRGGEKQEDEEKVPLLLEETESEDSEPDEKREEERDDPVNHKRMSEEAKAWLRRHECSDEVIEMFEQHGYWNLHYIASMKREDFEAIGIKKRGFILRLVKAAKTLPVMVIRNDIPSSVDDWLQQLEMEEYTDLFHAEGYRTEEDIENLKDLNAKELKKMGIHKRAHVQRLQTALQSLFYPTTVEERIHAAKTTMSCIPLTELENEECRFWKKILSQELKPVTIQFQQTSKDTAQKLKSLRNATLAILLLINIMWIVLLYTVTFPQLEEYDLPAKAFQLLFLAVYGLIILVSFIALLAHRLIMLMQFLGRPQVVEDAMAPPPADFAEVTIAIRETTT